MGGDVIIGVHLEEAELGGDVSLTAFGTLSESFSVITAVNERRGMESADLLVTVDVSKFTFADFNQPGPLIAQGYKAAEKNAGALLKFALNDRDWEAHLARREARRVKTVPAPTFLAVTGTTPEQADLIKKNVHLPEGNTVDVGELEDKLRLVTGAGRFASVGFSMTEQDRRPGLNLTAVEKDYAPPTVNPIFIVDGSQYDNVLFSAGARFTFLDVGRTGAELRADLLAGSTYQFAAEYWRPIASRRWFIAPRTLVSSVPVNLYSYSTQIAGYRAARANGGFDLGYSFDRFSQFRAGYELGWESYRPFVGNPQLLPTVSGQQSLTRMRYVLDKLDSPTVPREGTAALIGFDFYDHRPGAEDKVPLLRADMQFFKPIHRNDSVYFSASGGTTFGFSKTGVPLFSLGGPLRLSAYGANEILTNQYFLFQVGYLRQIGKLPRILGNNVYFNSVYEVAKPYKTQFAQLNGYSRVPMDAAAGMVVETIFGPAFIGGSWGDAGHRKIFFQLGRVF
jgi:NTE family protein